MPRPRVVSRCDALATQLSASVLAPDLSVTQKPVFVFVDAQGDWRGADGYAHAADRVHDAPSAYTSGAGRAT